MTSYESAESWIHKTCKGLAERHGVECSHPIAARYPRYDDDGNQIESSVDMEAFRHVRVVHIDTPSKVDPRKWVASAVAFDLRNPDHLRPEYAALKFQDAVLSMEEAERELAQQDALAN